MKFQIVYRGPGAEVHSEQCRDIDQEHQFWADKLVDAEHQYGAAWKAWEGKDAEYEIIHNTQFFPCLAEESGRPNRRRSKVSVPFDIEEDTAAEILEACYGRVIRWRRDMDDEEEFASLYPAGPHPRKIRGEFVDTFPHRYTEITISSEGRRILQFLDSGKGKKNGGTGFRAVALDTIVSVK